MSCLTGDSFQTSHGILIVLLDDMWNMLLGNALLSEIFGALSSTEKRVRY